MMLRLMTLWGMALTLALSPWYVIRFTILGIPTTLLECILLLTIGTWLTSLVLSLRHFNLITSCRRAIGLVVGHRSVALPMGLFLLAASLAVLFSGDIVAALGIYKAYIVEPMVFAIMLWSTISRKDELWLVAGAMLVAALQVMVLALSQFLLGWPNFAPDELIQGRSSAMYNTANAVGLFIAPILLLSGVIAVGWWQKRRMISTCLGLTAIAGMIVIIISRSEGAMVGMVGATAIGLIMLALKRLRWLSERDWRRLAGLGVIGYTAAVMVFMAWFNHPPQVENPYTRPGFSTFTVRQCTWQGTIAWLAEHPVTGSGLAGFTQAYLQTATCDAEPLVYPHNILLNFWTETGLLGLISILLLMTTWLQLAGKVFSWDGEWQWWGLGLNLALIYWLIHGLVDVPYFKNDLSLLWWSLFGLVVVIGLKLPAELADEASQSQH